MRPHQTCNESLAGNWEEDTYHHTFMVDSYPEKRLLSEVMYEFHVVYRRYLCWTQNGEIHIPPKQQKQSSRLMKDTFG